MYVAETLQLPDEQKQLFISRVPLNINDAKELVGKAPAMSLEPVEGYEDYYSTEVPSCYGEVQQRWFLFLNKKRRLSEQKTLTRKMQKQSLKEARDLEKLGKKVFLCRDDALKAFTLWQKQSKLCQSATELEVTGKPCYLGKGRPSPDSKPDHFEYFVQAECFVPCERRENAQVSLGCFIPDTNELDQNCMNATELLSTYKSQQQVEGGFRFLKSPDFLVSSLYLKKAERIEALLMVMTLCLMVYAAIQHRIRHELKKQSRVFSNQKKKPCQNPTARWVFFCFQGINVLRVKRTSGRFEGKTMDDHSDFGHFLRVVVLRIGVVKGSYIILPEISHPCLKLDNVEVFSHCCQFGFILFRDSIEFSKQTHFFALLSQFVQLCFSKLINVFGFPEVQIFLRVYCPP